MSQDAVQSAMNEQIKHELQSAYLYLSAAGYFESINLSGAASWMRLQSEEEVMHAMKFFNFIHDRGARVVLQALDQPESDFESPLDVFTKALAHEKEVTALIHKLYGLAVQDKDYPAQVLLQWFVSEQVEEEKNAGRVVDELKMVGDNSSALLLLDRELASRQAGTAAPPGGGGA